MNSSTFKPLHLRGRRLVLTKNMIIGAQDNSKSASGASRWLGVSYNTYKKWAKYYNIFEKHLNQSGIGIKKGWASYKIPLEKLLDGSKKLPKNYSISTLKHRLIEEGYFQEECSVCNYNEINLSTGKVCLNIDFSDGNNKNLNIENMRLLCPNCYLSFNGYFYKSKIFCK